MVPRVLEKKPSESEISNFKISWNTGKSPGDMRESCCYSDFSEKLPVKAYMKMENNNNNNNDNWNLRMTVIPIVEDQRKNLDHTDHGQNTE